MDVKAQIALLLSQSAPLSRILDEAPLGVCILDPQKKVILVNRAFQALTGLSGEDSSGVSCAHVLRSNICVENCPADCVANSSMSVQMEGNLLDRSHCKVPVRLNCAALRCDDGSLIGYIEWVEDIRHLDKLTDLGTAAFGFGSMIGRSPEMERMSQILPVVARTDAAVLLTGETGTGKDFAAGWIHNVSSRARKPLVRISCGALPHNLLEAELFGETKKSARGAIETRPGKLRLATGGTVYLSDISDLPITIQAKLLGFIDNGMFHPVGSTEAVHADVRVIAATHRNLEQMVAERLFREDFLHRLNSLRLHLPPLRERGDDVRLLLDHYLGVFALRLQKTIKGISLRAVRVLREYAYPGNVRELRNIIEYAANACSEDLIQLKHLPAYLTETRSHAIELQVPANVSETREHSITETDPGEGELDWSVMERKMILEALTKSHGRKSEAAALLGWSRSTLWRKLKQYGPGI